MKLTKKIKKIFKNKYVNFTISTIILLLIVLWTFNFWLLIIEIIIIDFYLTKKVNWTFWKKKGVKKHKWWIEWIDAAIFAIIAATIIRTLLIEAYTIPTSSMEKSLLVGDYLFVSKYHYGPRLPITPVAFPFAHHTLPGTKNTKAYIDKIQMRYKRLKGIEKIENNDVVVFNFPDGDTVVLNMPAQSYYQLCRDFGRQNVWSNQWADPNTGHVYNFGKIIYRPVDKRENYIKRCVAIPGDSLQVIDGQLYINGEAQIVIPGLQNKYIVVTDGSPMNPKVFENLGISNEDQANAKYIDRNILTYMDVLIGEDLNNIFMYPLTDDKVELFRKIPNVKSVTQIIKPKNYKENYIFPHTTPFYQLTNESIEKLQEKAIADSLISRISILKDSVFRTQIEFETALNSIIGKYSTQTYKSKIFESANHDLYAWNEDNFGPIYLPEEGATIKINIDNLPIYRRIIETFEENELKVENDKIFINGEETDEYTFKMDYYFMMGDSRHNSQDSRFWGYVPDNHIVGKALFVWLSLDKDKSFISKIRWNKFFTKIK